MAKQTIKTEDGVEVTSGDIVWLARDGIPSREVKEGHDGTLWVPARGKRGDIPFFSTRGAAIVARLQEQRINFAAIEKELQWLEIEAKAEATTERSSTRTQSRRKVTIRKGK
jgi:hypothetical protein